MNEAFSGYMEKLNQLIIANAILYVLCYIEKKYSFLYVARQQMYFELSLFLYTYLYGCILYVLHIISF